MSNHRDKPIDTASFHQWPKMGVLLLVGETQLQDPENKSLGNLEKLAIEYAKNILADGLAHSERSNALFEAKTHTDFSLIQPEVKSQWIKIDQIRELIIWASGKPQIATKKVAIISPAHTLNIQAANALLKTLEESSENTLFMLVTDRPSFIPATIRSRCYWIRCRDLDQNCSNKDLVVAPEQLKLKNQMIADLKALNAKNADPVLVGGEWVKQNPKEVLYWLLIILHEELKKTVPRFKACWDFIDKVFEAKREMESPNQPNIQLLFESLLIEYCTVSAFI